MYPIPNHHVYVNPHPPTNEGSIRDTELISRLQPPSYTEINMAGPRRVLPHFPLLYWGVPCNSIPLSCSDIPWNASGDFEKTKKKTINSLIHNHF
ncbi:hypothetical protein BDV26DRAFT_87281 [Aspergillus bertholletiae]|uniref:Uncharacterized protein n=1 Tax=Aspergillus bertholletiae TaxID=1226010 RepID=A0A5N7AU01_9EURO|nr:hypothetical protein BDV26DRAFT_87281 [Aspergillus bertholletiae]